MLPWTVLIMAVFSCSICTCAAQQRSKALFPAAARVKRGMVKPTFQNSIEDINLLYEIMLSGLQIGDESIPFGVQDEELASLRKTRTLETICEDVLPKSLKDIRRLAADLSQHQGPLRKSDFERTVLTMVYAANRLANTSGHQRDNWAESFVSLYRALKQDLRGQ
ncbi:protein FAM180A [Conger conger]|nr:protein FAM180A [Conger conger]